MWKRAVIALPCALAGALWFEFLVLPWPISLRWTEPSRTALIEYRRAQAERQGKPLQIRKEWVPASRMSRHLRRAVIVAEDARFYQHKGVDWSALGDELHYAGRGDFSWADPADLRALVGALQYYRSHRARVRGRSTITQQLAKNLYFDPERSLLRKFEELVVAQRLEQFLSKDRILELYLNVVEWGPGVFGAEAAARHYFGRSAAGLTREQAAALAATLPHPLTSNPKRRPGRMEWRKRLILARMGARGPVKTVPLEPPPEIQVAEPELLYPDSMLPVPALPESAAPPAPVPTDTAAPAPAHDTLSAAMQQSVFCKATQRTARSIACSST